MYIQKRNRKLNQQTEEHTADVEAAADEKGFVAAQYSNGVLIVTSFGFGEEIDREILYTYSTYSGVEIGPSTIVATNGEKPCYLCFAGTLEEQRAVFKRWHEMAMENERPAIFELGGLKAVVDLGPTLLPPYPELDIAETESLNENMKKLLGVSRQLANEMAQTKELTEQDCDDIVDAVRQASEQPTSKNA